MRHFYPHTLAIQGVSAQTHAWKNKLWLLLLLLLWGCTSAVREQPDDASVSSFNHHWTFIKQAHMADTAGYLPTINDSTWAKVSLPHTASLEPEVITGQQWQGICWYRKRFTPPKNAQGKHVALYFEGAMQVADVWLNGTKLATHYGGYLPFYVDLTHHIDVDQENVIAVRLNNEDNPQVPPGKPIQDLDFNYYSGLYRPVHLIVKNKVHLTHPIAANVVSGGGVFVRTLKATAQEGVIHIKTHVLNQSADRASVALQGYIFDPFGNEIHAFANLPKALAAAESTTFEATVTIENPARWTPESPHHYTLAIDLMSEGQTIDFAKEKFGLRTIAFDSSGFYLNGEKYRLRGTNRHQEYPYIGYALSDHAHERDARNIKDAGFNFVRLSHYPHSQAFMKACDTQGLLVMDAIPGWQFFGDSVFQKRAYEDIRQMIRRDRNHPSVILWEASLNESPMTEAFMDEANRIVHEELPGPATYSCGWIDYAYDVFIPARQHAQAPDYWKTYDTGKPFFIAEYGDWEYYAQNAGFHQKEFANLQPEERSSRQLRAHGQKRLLQQALNYQEAHNDNLQSPAAGDANWLMFDYNRGYAPDIESSGVMDIFRLPKFSYYFYRSQKDLSTGDTVLFIAHYWQPQAVVQGHTPNPSQERNDVTTPLLRSRDVLKSQSVKIYSNAEEVALYVNDEFIAQRKPDQDRNATHLKHPPFTFQNVPYAAGALKAVAYHNGQKIAESVRHTPGNPSNIKLTLDDSGVPLQAHANDVVFVHATVVDSAGHAVPSANDTLTFEVKGDAELIGQNPIHCRAGIASILLKAGASGGKIEVIAHAKGLATGSLIIKIKFFFNQSDPYALKSCQDAFLSGQDAFLHGQDAFLHGQDAFLHGQDAFLHGQDAFLSGQDAFLSGQDAFLSGQDAFLSGQDAFLSGQDAFLSGQDAFLHGQDAFLHGQDAFVRGINAFSHREIQLGLLSI